jgi:asparagine synthase (glutamine-hydrolysing)
MCGISGIAISADFAPYDITVPLRAMTNAMSHRGPDDEGISIDPSRRVGLGSRRLAIRDLSATGHMPMPNEEGTVWITYNGEVYNSDEIRPDLEGLGYHFRSGNDTEVILRGYEAWGEKIVHRLRGMFAFAIYDNRPQQGTPRLFLARDQLGIKPIYYAATQHEFFFGSELNTLLASGRVGRDLNPTGMVGYLLFGSVPNPLTIYRDIQALPPGHTLTLELTPTFRQPTLQQYWHLPRETHPVALGRDVVGEIRELLSEAVRMQMVSDVPIGAFLSGGLDSSIVVALMRQATNGTLRTCSIVFAESEYSEAPYAKAVADHVGAEHYERLITADEILQACPTIFSAMDQPTLDGVNSYFVSETARQAGLTVALSGLGGDELFGGYPHTFQQVPKVIRAMELTQRLPLGVPLAQAAMTMMPNAPKWSRFADALDRPASRAGAYLTRRGMFAPREVKALVGQELWEEATANFDYIEHVASRADSPQGDDFAWISRAELTTYTHHQLLRDTDVMSMAHSLEVRVPLLDHVLVERVLQLPATFKMNGGTPKPLMAKAVGDLLPDMVRNRRDKIGFVFPWEQWLKADFGRAVDPTQEPVLGLQPKAVRHIWSQFQEGKIHWSRAWTLVALNEWYRRRPN